MLYKKALAWYHGKMQFSTFFRLLAKNHTVLFYWRIFAVFAILFLVAFYVAIIKDLPSPTRLSSAAIPQSSQVFDRNGVLLYTIYSQKNQTFVPISQIPKELQQATIAIEDKDFYKHGAIDLRGIVRSFLSNISGGQLQGGSTITQQLVKNSLLTPERTITRKIKEVMLAFVTELLYSKDQILEMYLNQVAYGGTAWGVEAAGQMYFGKPVERLTLAQSALIASLPEAPTTYSPFGSRPELAKKRQLLALAKMREQGYISKEQEEKAAKEGLGLKKVVNDIKAPHFVLYIRDILEQKYGHRLVEEGGLKVTTTLDLALQEYAQASVAAEIGKLKNQRVSNGASLVTNPATGEILAMIGSRDYFDKEIDGNVNVTLALRQPGSSIKPINYAVGLIKGYTAASPFADAKVCYPNISGKEYCPVNYDGKWHGVVQMRQALGNSINIPAVKMLKANSVEAMIATASAMGITTFKDPNRYGLSLTLGGGEVTMVDMAVAYGVFANQGYKIDLHPILKVVGRNGKLLEEYTPPKSPIFGKKVIPPQVAFIISHILMDNGAREAAFGSNSQLKIGNQPVSVKTGTTNDFRDNWTIGYTPQYVVAAWVGNNDNKPMGNLTSGVTGAAPIWRNIIEHLIELKPASYPRIPEDIVGKTICSTSGLLPPPDGTPDRCPTRFEYFIKGTEPKQVDPGRQKVFIDKTTNDLAKPGQTDNVEERNELVVTDVVGDMYCLTCPHPVEEEKASN
ncbi:MAG: PBP1A family penicillin-binding protein [Candidatus Levybacteria bacterium]|nr:PBP1A family penicillin-binding protein [Candidatus Levybacteria bacterium]